MEHACRWKNIQSLIAAHIHAPSSPRNAAKAAANALPAISEWAFNLMSVLKQDGPPSMSVDSLLSAAFRGRRNWSDLRRQIRRIADSAYDHDLSGAN